MGGKKKDATVCHGYLERYQSVPAKFGGKVWYIEYCVNITSYLFKWKRVSWSYLQDEWL